MYSDRFFSPKQKRFLLFTKCWLMELLEAYQHLTATLVHNENSFETNFKPKTFAMRKFLVNC